jgi:hypothetical protein
MVSFGKSESMKDTSNVESNQKFDQQWHEGNNDHRSLSQAAADRSDLEHELTPSQAIRAYPMAIFWTLMVSMCVIMEGYDTILIGNVGPWLSCCLGYHN